MKRIAFFLIITVILSLRVTAQDTYPVIPFTGENYHYLWYEGQNDESQLASEFIYTWCETEVIGGRSYYVVYDIFYYYQQGYLKNIHMRQEGKKLLVRYDEYKELMQTKGHDMTDFDELCQYEVTDDGDMVLYDFGMQIGDKFRSVPGKEDIYVTGKSKPIESFWTNQAEEMEVIHLSNGARILDGVGYLESAPNSVIGRRGPEFFDYLNCGHQQIDLILVVVEDKYIYDNVLDGVPSNISSRKDDIVNQYYFDMTGRKHYGQPTTRGVYIQNGRKVVIK